MSDKKNFTIEQRIEYYKKSLDDLVIAERITMKLYENKRKFIEERAKALEKEKTGTKEK